MNLDGPTIGAVAATFFGLAKLVKAVSRAGTQLFFDLRGDEKKELSHSDVATPKGSCKCNTRLALQNRRR